MLQDQQASSHYGYAEEQEQSFDSMLSEEHQEQELLYQNEAATSILSKYYSADAQIFTRDTLTLNDLAPVRNLQECLTKRDGIVEYFTKSDWCPAAQQSNSRQGGLISDQFTAGLLRIPEHSIIYLCIYDIQGNRFNMLAHNRRGECLAYFSRLRMIKKVGKILKLLKKLSRNTFVVVLDRIPDKAVSLMELQKLSEAIQNFAYVFPRAGRVQIKSDGNSLRSEASSARKSTCSIHYQDDYIIVCPSHLDSLVKDGEIGVLIDRMETIESEQWQALRQVRGYYDQNQREVEYDHIFINVLRSFECEADSVLDIIIQLFKEKQTDFATKESMTNKLSKVKENSTKNPDSHFPEKMSQSRVCKRCECYKKRYKRTMVRCEGCSVTFNRDIALCPDCFSEFHRRIEYYTKRIKSKKRLKRPHRNLQNPEPRQSPEQKLTSNQEQQGPTNQGNEVKHEYLPENQNYCDKVLNGASEATYCNIVKIDNLIEESFEMVKSLAFLGHPDIAGLFLSAQFENCLKRMESLADKQPELNTGLTQCGAHTRRLIESQDTNPNILFLDLSFESILVQAYKQRQNLIQHQAQPGASQIKIEQELRGETDRD